MSRDIQTYIGYDGIVYANQKRRELLDRRIEALEVELAKLKELREKFTQ